jgi:hypothetical protein
MPAKKLHSAFGRGDRLEHLLLALARGESSVVGRGPK